MIEKKEFGGIDKINEFLQFKIKEHGLFVKPITIIERTNGLVMYYSLHEYLGYE